MQLRSKLAIVAGAILVLSALAVPAEERRGLPTIIIYSLGIWVAVFVLVDVVWGRRRRRAIAAEARRLGWRSRRRTGSTCSSCRSRCSAGPG